MAESSDRFSLLLLEDGEFFFRDYTINLLPTNRGQRIAGHLKVCSASLFFVPRNLHEPIFRMPYKTISKLERTEPASEAQNTGDEYFVVASNERMDLKAGNRNVPYIRHTGDFKFRFSLVYTSLGAVLPRIQELHRLTRLDDGERQARLAVLISEHERAVQFNPGWFSSADEEAVAEFEGARVTPLCSQPGRIVISQLRLYFQPFNVVSSAPILVYPLVDVISVMKRDYNLDALAVEVFFSETNSVYLTFRTSESRELFFKTLLEQPALQLKKIKSRERWTRDWVAGRVSNFDYLMHLNREADRSFNDLTQYPVFPWVLQDYTSSTLDLKDPASYRDLSKPIGALNPDRLEGFRDRFDEMEEMAEEMSGTGIGGEGAMPPFMFGTHYSTPGYVVYWLLRKAPQLMLRLQNGRFDMPDRLLHNIQETWEGVMTMSTDLKELIPEFYNPAAVGFLVNTEGLDFGNLQSGERVDDVKLPPWAKDAHDFVHKMRLALESPIVSARLHQWIDLIFGSKQRGEQARRSDNVFHYLTYDDLGRKELEKVKDPELRRAIKLQMCEFGRTPRQLFTKAHPRRRVGVYTSVFAPCFGPSASVGSAGGSTGSLGSAAAIGGDDYQFRPSGVFHGDPEVPKLLKKAARSGVSPWLLEQRELAVEALETRAASLPDSLELGSYALLLPMQRLLRSNLPQDTALASRALKALSACPLNREKILAAGCLEPIVDCLCGEDPMSINACAGLVARLALEERSELLMNFNVSAMASLIEMMHEGGDALRFTACSALARLGKSDWNRVHVLQLGGLPPLVALLQARHAPVLRRCAAATLAILVQDDEAKMQMVELGGLSLCIEMCEEADTENQIAAVHVLAALSTLDRLKLEITARGGLRLLCAAACSTNEELQKTAASALANLCSDAAIINVVVREEGLWSVVQMAQSPSPEVQRHAARAFWHLAVHHENKRHILEMGGVQSLLLLSRLGERNLQACLLAEEALRRLSEDVEVAQELEREKEAVDGPLIVGGGLASLVPNSPQPNVAVRGTPGQAYRAGVDTPSTRGNGSPGRKLIESPPSPSFARTPTFVQRPDNLAMAPLGVESPPEN
ncbi:factor associated with neutral sphingomyelinase activation [Pycnococcus provasolii]